MNQAFSDEIEDFLRLAQRLRDKHGLRFQPPGSETAGLSISTADLMDLARMQNVFYPIKFVSHRRFLGPFITFFKRQVVKVLDPYLRRRLTRQFEINQVTWNLAQIIHRQDIQIDDLKARLSQLESRPR